MKLHSPPTLVTVTTQDAEVRSSLVARSRMVRFIKKGWVRSPIGITQFLFSTPKSHLVAQNSIFSTKGKGATRLSCVKQVVSVTFLYQRKLHEPSNYNVK